MIEFRFKFHRSPIDNKPENWFSCYTLHVHVSLACDSDILSNNWTDVIKDGVSIHFLIAGKNPYMPRNDTVSMNQWWLVDPPFTCKGIGCLVALLIKSCPNFKGNLLNRRWCKSINNNNYIPWFYVDIIRGPFYHHGLTLILAWICNHMPTTMWDEITHPFLNFNGCTIEVQDWISNFIPHFIGDVITYSFCD